MPLSHECQNPFCLYELIPAGLVDVATVAEKVGPLIHHEGQIYLECPLCRSFNLVAANRSGRIVTKTFSRILPSPAGKGHSDCQKPGCAFRYRPESPDDRSFPERFLVRAATVLGPETYLRCPLCGTLNQMTKLSGNRFEIRGFRPPRENTQERQ